MIQKPMSSTRSSLLTLSRRESSRKGRAKSSPLMLGLINTLREALGNLAADIVDLLRFSLLKIFDCTNLVQNVYS
jgi:hypothetical protein